jgi:hypothetical protein
LIRYARASSNYSDFLKRHLLLRNRLLDQGYAKIRLIPHSRYKSKNDADEAVSVVSLTSSSGGYINGRNSANLELLIDKTSSMYLYVKLKAQEQVISMLEFLIDIIFVSFGGTLFQQVVGIPMGTNCAPLLADLVLYSYESEFLQKLVKYKKIHEARAFKDDRFLNN